MLDPPETDRAGGIAELQRLVDEVPRQWLDGLAVAEARRLSELVADRELLDRLMWSGYEGSEYDRFVERLARYGFAVIGAWCRRGLIFARCAAKGWKLQEMRLSEDDATELAAETVAVALVKFRQTVLIPGVWDHEKGASLNSFFIGQCLLRFTNVYRRWQGEQLRYQLDDGSGVVGRQIDQRLGPDQRTLRRVEAREALSAIPDALTQQIVLFKADGHTNEEIAELCQVSLSVVKTRLYRLQQRKGQGDAA